MWIFVWRIGVINGNNNNKQENVKHRQDAAKPTVWTDRLRLIFSLIGMAYTDVRVGDF